MPGALRLPLTASGWSRAAVGSAAVALTTAGLLFAVAAPAAAHPHIWVSVRTTVLYENGAVTGFRHAWTFDEYYTAMAIEGLDANKDGKYAREELAELAKVNVEALKEFGYFTFAKLKGQDLAVGVPKDYYLEHAPRTTSAEAATTSGTSPVLPRTGAERISTAATPGSELTLHFTLPLAKPVLAEAEGFGFSLGDPSFFIAFEPARDTPVSLGPGAPPGCRVAGADGKAVEANPSKPGDLMAAKPSDLSVNFVSAPSWQVICAPAG